MASHQLCWPPPSLTDSTYTDGLGPLPPVQDPDSRFNLITRGSQVFFAFIGLCIYIALAAFQSRWNVGPSFMSGFGLAVNVIALIAGGVFRE